MALHAETPSLGFRHGDTGVIHRDAQDGQDDEGSELLCGNPVHPVSPCEFQPDYLSENCTCTSAWTTISPGNTGVGVLTAPLGTGATPRPTGTT